MTYPGWYRQFDTVGWVTGRTIGDCPGKNSLPLIPRLLEKVAKAKGDQVMQVHLEKSRTYIHANLYSTKIVKKACTLNASCIDQT